MTINTHTPSLHVHDKLVVLDDQVVLASRLYQVTGAEQRPVIILLHEALGCLAMWKDFPAQLASQTGHSVLAYERRGYGSSSPITLPRPDDYLVEEGEVWLPRLLDALSLNRVILFGHSDGGSIALVGAASRPEQVVAVITEAAHIYIDHLTRTGIEAARERYECTDLKARLSRYHGERTDLIFRAWHETWLREKRWPLDLRPWLGRIRCPALIMQGKQDQYGVPEQVLDICQGIGPHALPLFLDDCAHVPHFEAGTAVLAATVQLLHRLD